MNYLENLCNALRDNDLTIADIVYVDDGYCSAKVDNASELADMLDTDYENGDINDLLVLFGANFWVEVDGYDFVVHKQPKEHRITKLKNIEVVFKNTEDGFIVNRNKRHAKIMQDEN